MSLTSRLITWEVKRHMNEIVAKLIEWVTLGPLKGYRTVILSTVQFILAGLYGTHHLTLLTSDQYASISAMLAAAIGVAAANHQVTPPKP